MDNTSSTHKEAFPATPEQVETELAYLEPEAMANPEDYQRVKAELAAPKIQVFV